MTDSSFDNHPSHFPQSPDWEALARELTGETMPGDEDRIRPGDRELLERMSPAIATLSTGAPSDIEIESALRKVKARPDFRAAASAPVIKRPRWLIPMPALAAAALLAVGVASWMAYENRPKEQAVAGLEARMLGTGVGLRDSMTLSDGTRVIIGPLSSVKVAAGYGATSREVEIRGDAWFDVVHDESRPFTVHAGSATIVDIGTKFAVQSDNPDGVSVSVSEGSVSLRQVNTPPQQGVILKAGDNGLLQNGGQVIARRGSVTDDDMAWLRGKLVFRDAPISEVVNSVRKWYGIEVKVADRSLENRHLTATFAGETPERVLEVIRLALGADIERRGDTAIVRSAKGNTRSR
jgi:transmembrane sensor